MPTRSVTLSEEEDGIVDDLVRSGRFRSADEVVRAGLRLVAKEDDDENCGCTPEELKAAIQVGLDDLENGRFLEFANVDELAAHIRGRTDDLLSGRRKPR